MTTLSTLGRSGHDMTTLLKNLRLPTAADEMIPRLIEAGYADAIDVVREVFEAEREVRWERRIQRLLSQSRLPFGKTFDTFDIKRLPTQLAFQLRQLRTGEFVDEAINVLAFGLPGTGKTHAVCALGHELIRQGRTVLFVPTFRLVQELLAARRDLELPKALKRLNKIEVLILDDIGYVKQDPDEIEVLFTLLSERYERGSVVITSNLTFSQWDQIFQNPMTTAAAIDRLVHHSSILEFHVQSYRVENRSHGTNVEPIDNKKNEKK